MREYLNDETINNWKSFVNDNPIEGFFPIEKYENSKYLLFKIWSAINNNIFADLSTKLDIIDIYYIINFIYNEIAIKTKKNIIENSKILELLNKNKDNLNINKEINIKIKKLLGILSSNNFFNNKKIMEYLKLFFFMIKLYIIGFIGYKNNSLFSLIFSDKIAYLIKIFYNNNLKEEMIYIKSYYEMKKYLEEEYLKNNNYYPVYFCNCGRWYKIKDSLPKESKECECGNKIERDNHYAIYYDEYQQKYIEERKADEMYGKRLKGKLLKEFKEEFIIQKIIIKCQHLDKLLLKEYNIDDKTFPQEFLRFIFLSQLYIEYKIENEIFDEFKINNLFDDLIDLYKRIEEYIKSKNINYTEFMNYSCDALFNLIENIDCLLEKNKIFISISEILKQLEQKYKNNRDLKNFNNIETDILTSLTFNEQFKNENLKYLLIVAQYPNEDLLNNSILVYKNNSFPILKAFLFLDANKYNLSHLDYIETINDFINSFSEKNRNQITRKDSDKFIGTILDELDENNRNILKKQFNAFTIPYWEINNEEITLNTKVIKILNDDKIKGKETSINKLYCRLIEIQNYYLNKIIDEYDKAKDNKKGDIIIKNAIEQIKIKKKIQLCTKADIFSFNVSNKIFLSFKELYSFYSLKNIFEGKNGEIDYSKYSEVKFKLNMIEKELVNTILTGKKLFSEEQVTYKFNMDPYEIEEKTKKFEKFKELYGEEKLSDEEKVDLANLSDIATNLKRIILPSLEILIYDLLEENKYQGINKISQVKIHSNIYIDERFFQLFNNFNKFTINKLIPIYEYLEEVLFNFIEDEYIDEAFKENISEEYKKKLNDYYDNEKNRELKNDLLKSLLIKYACRYLPKVEKEDSKVKDLFEMIREKNLNLTEQILLDLNNLKDNLGARLSHAVEITKLLIKKQHIRKMNIVNDRKRERIEKIEERIQDKQEEIFENDEDEQERNVE